jgi:hypothetical protein
MSMIGSMFGERCLAAWMMRDSVTVRPAQGKHAKKVWWRSAVVVQAMVAALPAKDWSQQCRNGLLPQGTHLRRSD